MLVADSLARAYAAADMAHLPGTALAVTKGALLVIAAICAAIVAAICAEIWRESGQEGANAWPAVCEDYEGPQEAEMGAYAGKD